MLSVLFGLITACCFASGTLCSSRTARTIGPLASIAWICLVGLVITTPFLFMAGIPSGLDFGNTMWLVAAGAGNLGGLIIAYFALRIGKVGVVAPILSTEGALAAVIAAITGESIAPIVAFLLLLIVLGVVLAAIAPDPQPLAHEKPTQAVLLATLAALAFAIGLFAPGHLSGELPIAWILLPTRLLGVIVLVIPLLVLRKLPITRQSAPLVTLTGITEVVGFTMFSLGAMHSVAITAVMSSLFAPIAAVAAYLLFKERLGGKQIGAVALIVASVSALTLAINASS